MLCNSVLNGAESHIAPLVHFTRCTLPYQVDHRTFTQYTLPLLVMPSSYKNSSCFYLLLIFPLFVLFHHTTYPSQWHLVFQHLRCSCSHCSLRGLTHSIVHTLMFFASKPCYLKLIALPNPADRLQCFKINAANYYNSALTTQPYFILLFDILPYCYKAIGVLL